MTDEDGNTLFNQDGSPQTEIDFDAPIDVRGLRNVSVPSSSGSKSGVIDRRGAWIIHPKFDSLSETPDANGHRQVTIGSAQGIIDKDGRWIVYPKTSITITVPPTSNTASPSITSQPVSQNTVVGGTATFTVVAEASVYSLSYQWQKNNANILPAPPPPPTPIANVQSSDAGIYRVIVTNTGVVPATFTATSSTVALTVVDP